MLRADLEQAITLLDEHKSMPYDDNQLIALGEITEGISKFALKLTGEDKALFIKSLKRFLASIDH
jgi:hypothetical protein